MRSEIRKFSLADWSASATDRDMHAMELPIGVYLGVASPANRTNPQEL
jgi:hypothetical protein